jgi:hypothetical protein
MISIGRSSLFFLTLIVLLVPMAFAIGQPASMSWPVAQLTGERRKAETCVGLAKKYGDPAQIARGQLTYANAKADVDAVIAGLILVLTIGEQPKSWADLRSKLSNSLSGLAEFCDAFEGPIPSAAGQRSIATEVTKGCRAGGCQDGAVQRTDRGVYSGNLLEMVPDILAALQKDMTAMYNKYRNENALTRRRIQTQLEATRWPAFAEVRVAD